jgi:hypothetical protein
MTEKTLVVLMGEQPTPLLLSIREQEPDRVIIIYTNKTQKRAKNLKKVIEDKVEERNEGKTKEGRDKVSVSLGTEEHGDSKVTLVPTEAYGLYEIMQAIERNLPSEDGNKVIFDVTGGTKVMALAAALVAQRRQAWASYIKTSRSQGTLFRYDISRSPYPEDCSAPLEKDFQLKEYLALYLENFTFETPPPSDNFERAVYEALSGHFDEILCTVKQGDPLEIDIVVRCGIQVGIIEVKRRGRKKGIDQLNTAGGRDYLGTWVKKFYVVNEEWDQNDRGMQGLRELAEARRITLIELPSFTESPPAISPEDKEKLVETIRQAMACK